ncbi:MAG TPA: FxLYD domain-containing protein [Nocardioidaceae bacterium]|nr:FxLYD domain-containing protein [Nocardioidaceae bacterium]
MKWIGIAVLLLALAACGGDEEPGPQPGELPFIPELAESVPAAKDMTMGSCALEEGAQTVEGRVTNSGSAAADYVITISWVDDALELRGKGVAVIEDLAPGESEDWSATGQVLDGATQCIPATFRGELEP